MDRQIHMTMTWIDSLLARAFKAEPREGQGLVEYALILLLVAVAAVGAVSAFGTALIGLYATIVSGLPL
jgi:Flp pilus assembly pilin Flp